MALTATTKKSSWKWRFLFSVLALYVGPLNGTAVREVSNQVVRQSPARTRVMEAKESAVLGAATRQCIAKT
jgi:hypothetical protein